MQNTLRQDEEREFSFSEREFSFLAGLVSNRTGIMLAANKKNKGALIFMVDI